MASRKQEHIEQITERCLIAQKNFSLKERAERDNIDATDLDELIANFLLEVREFLFLICVKKTISMKILVLRLINSSRHRNCSVRGYIHSLFVSKALTRSYLARSGFDTNNSSIQPRTPHFLCRIYIYNPPNNFCELSLDKIDRVIHYRAMVIRRYSPSDLISVV